MTFTCFPLLPLEIRNRIWQATFSGRIITLDLELPSRPSHAQSPGFFNLAAAHASMPIALRISQESRAEALFHYKDLIQNPSVSFSLSHLFQSQAWYYGYRILWLDPSCWKNKPSIRNLAKTSGALFEESDPWFECVGSSGTQYSQHGEIYLSTYTLWFRWASMDTPTIHSRLHPGTFFWVGRACHVESFFGASAEQWHEHSLGCCPKGFR